MQALPALSRRLHGALPVHDSPVDYRLYMDYVSRLLVDEEEKRVLL